MTYIPKGDTNLFQYKTATRFCLLRDGMYSEIDNSSMGPLRNFLDYTVAVGDWLTQLAAIFNVKRTVSGFVNAFIVNISFVNGPALINGTPAPLNDALLLALLKARIKKNNRRKTINYLIDIFNETVSPTDIRIEEGDKILDFYLDFTGNPSGVQILLALTSDDPNWFGRPNGCSINFYLTV